MNVIKRNGETDPVSFDKITRRISQLAHGLDINPIWIAQKICAQLVDGILTRDIDEFTSRVAASKCTTHPDYGVIAVRISISNHHKTHKCMLLNSFSDKVEVMYDAHSDPKKRIQLVSDEYYATVQQHKQVLNDMIDYERDYEFDFFGYKTLEKSYLHKRDGVCIETPQDMILRVCIGIHGDDMERVRESYDNMSAKYFTHASPTLFNAGSPRAQYLSCFLCGVDDSLESIYDSYKDCAMISKHAGGIGVHISDLRGNGSVIRGINGTSSGLVPVCRQYNMTALHANQGSRRKGSIALYLEPHHPDIFDFLNLKRPHGDEERKARDIFPALWISDLFMERVEKDEMWSVFTSNEIPEKLTEVYGDEYRRLYTSYEEQGLYTDRVPARKIWKAIVESQIESGTPYIGYKDAVNRKNNQQHYGVIKSSNLCIEINEVSTADEYACCTLSSICLPRFVDVVSKGGSADNTNTDKNNNNQDLAVVNEDGANCYTFNYEKLIEIVRIIVRNLDNIIDKNVYPVHQTEKSNMLHRPLGIGVQGLADVFIKSRIAYDSQKASALNKMIFETIYYAAVTASVELAKERGQYPTFPGSPASRGVLQFDMWGVTPSDRYDWDGLRESVRANGLRNSLLVALMPTASTSQIMGNAESFEPYQSNIFKRQTLAGTFVVVNKHLISDLIERGIWSGDVKDKIIANHGSVQNIVEIPDDIKKLYKTIWEISNRTYIDMSADRGAYVCQSQSLNLWMSRPTYRNITSMHLYSWKRGLKTGQYYLRSQPPVDPQQFTIDPVKLEEPKQKNAVVCTDDICTMCSS